MIKKICGCTFKSVDRPSVLNVYASACASSCRQLVPLRVESEPSRTCGRLALQWAVGWSLQTVANFHFFLSFIVPMTAILSGGLGVKNRVAMMPSPCGSCRLLATNEAFLSPTGKHFTSRKNSGLNKWEVFSFKGQIITIHEWIPTTQYWSNNMMMMMMTIHDCHKNFVHAELGMPSQPKSGVLQHPCSNVEPPLTILEWPWLRM